METNGYDGAYGHDNPQRKTDDLARNIIEQNLARRATLLFVGLTIVLVLIALLLLMRGQENRKQDAEAIGN